MIDHSLATPSRTGVVSLVRSALVGSAFAVLAITAGVGAAQAQACADTEFTTKVGDAYLSAEKAFLVDNNPQAAITQAEALLKTQVNCYERTAISRLLSAAYLKTGQNVRAAQMLEGLLTSGAIPASDRTKTLLTLGQIYLQAQDLNNADRFMSQWLQAGGRPDRDQNWQMAVLKHKLNNPNGAIQFAEAVLNQDGGSAKPEVIDFLIYLYDQTNQRAKKAGLLERKLAVNPTDKTTWEAIAGDYFKGGEERKAFEATKAMYLAGILRTEDELMRVVNFYNRFDAPFQAARVLEKEMNAGRINKTLEKYELLAQLYQVAREYDRAIPILKQASQMSGRTEFVERAGRSYFELGKYRDAIELLTQATQKSGMKEPAYSRVLIGQAKYELNDRAGAKEAFSAAANQSGDPNGVRAARAWLDFLRSEEETKAALVRFNLEVKKDELRRRIDFCKKGDILRQEGATDKAGEDCAKLEAELAALQGTAAAAPNAG